MTSTPSRTDFNTVLLMVFCSAISSGSMPRSVFLSFLEKMMMARKPTRNTRKMPPSIFVMRASVSVLALAVVMPVTTAPTCRPS